MSGMPSAAPVAVLGARSLVGDRLLPRLTAAGHHVLALTRRAPLPPGAPGVSWRQVAEPAAFAAAVGSSGAPLVVSLAPLWALPDFFDVLVAAGTRCVVALSSQSMRTKALSPAPAERLMAGRLASAEAGLAAWGASAGVGTVILRPTMVWGGGRDHNVTELACFARRFGFVPVVGAAAGLRQPVHADDVAAACVAALALPPSTGSRAYDLAGAERLSYRRMVERIMVAAGRRPRVVGLPRSLVLLGGTVLRLLPRYRSWTPAQADRQGVDLVADHGAAGRDLGFRPRPFTPGPEDVAA